MFGGQQTGQQALRLVEDWIPEKAYTHERKFQNDLQSFLDEELNATGQFGGVDGGHEYVVSKERGNAKGDVVVDDIVGIELKRDLSNSQTKKLRGQIEAYLDNYPVVIVCACGIDDVDGWRELKNKYSGGIGFGLNAGEVYFVHKRTENMGGRRDDRSRGGDGFLGGLF